jgi:hypothetical protein
MKKLTLASLLLMAFHVPAQAALATVADATPLRAGESIYLPPLGASDTFLARPNPAVVAERTTEFIVDRQFSALMRTVVLDGPEPGVNLDFYYQFFNRGVTAQPDHFPYVASIRFAGFDSSPIQVAQFQNWFPSLSTPGGPYYWPDNYWGHKTALGVSYEALSNGFQKGVVQFDIGAFHDPCCLEPHQSIQDKLLVGADTYTFLIRTNATQLTDGLVTLSYGGNVGGLVSGAAFQPAVPEPGTNALIVLGLGMMGFVVRRRTRKQS